MILELKPLRSHVAIALLTTVLLGACGGGDPAVTPTAITEQTAADSAFDSYQLVDAMLSSGSNSFASSGTPKATGHNGTPSIVDLTIRHAQRANPGAAFQQVGINAILSQTNTCVDGGTSVFSLNDVNNNAQLDEADGITITYSNCAQFGVTQSGVMSISNISLPDAQIVLSGNFGMTVHYNNLTVTDANGSYTLNGQMSIATSVVGNVTTVSISGPSLQINSDGASGQLGSFTASTSVDSGNGTFSHTMHGTIASAGWTVTNPVSFTGTVGTYPSAGMLRVVDADGAIVTLTAQGQNVLIQFDQNGDGTPESSQTQSWADLAAATQ